MKSKEEILVDEIIERLKTRPEDFYTVWNTDSQLYWIVSKNFKVGVNENGVIDSPFTVSKSANKRLEELITLLKPFISKYKEDKEAEKWAKLKNLWD